MFSLRSESQGEKSEKVLSPDRIPVHRLGSSPCQHRYFVPTGNLASPGSRKLANLMRIAILQAKPREIIQALNVVVLSIVEETFSFHTFYSGNDAFQKERKSVSCNFNGRSMQYLPG
jgi:hypothetical protein